MNRRIFFKGLAASALAIVYTRPKPVYGQQVYSAPEYRYLPMVHYQDAEQYEEAGYYSMIAKAVDGEEVSA